MLKGVLTTFHWVIRKKHYSLCNLQKIPKRKNKGFQYYDSRFVTVLQTTRLEFAGCFRENTQYTDVYKNASMHILPAFVKEQAHKIWQNSVKVTTLGSICSVPNVSNTDIASILLPNTEVVHPQADGMNVLFRKSMKF